MDNNVGLFLSKRAQLSPGLEGLVEVESGRRLSYSELDAGANRTAGLLRRLGIRRGDRVALLLPNRAEYVETFFAVAKIGAIAVPLNWRLVPDELAFILGDSGASVLVYGAPFRSAVEELERRTGVTEVRHWVQAGDEIERPPFALSYSDLHGESSPDEPPIGARDDDDLYIMYTSGTTGLPKGAVHSHASAIWACITINQTADMRYRDRYMVALPMFHVGALTPFTANVQRGVTNVLLGGFDPGLAWSTISRERVTVMLAVPAMLNAMLQVPEAARGDASTLRWCMSGAAPVPVTLIDAYARLGIEIHQVYGLTESCGPACLISPEDALAKAGSTGKPFFHTEVRVVDESGQDVTPGGVGEVLVRGRHLMKGYWRRPDATAETLQGGWLHTGDLASMDKEGFVYIQDRKKDMIISGGENIYPAEVENVLLSHPGVRDVAVIGQPSEKWGESPAAIVVPRDGSLTEEEVLVHCEGRLARYKTPRRVYFAEEIPRNPSGKVLKRVLRERFPDPAPE